jgi:hypothetical protein
MANEKTREDSVRLSVQSQPGIYSGMYMLGSVGMYAQTLPSLYDPSRQWYLRRISNHPQNNLWQSAKAGIARDVASAPWIIDGKRRSKYYQDLLLNAEKGEGWSAFIQKLLDGLHDSDDGAVVELIGRGKADKYLPKEQITGIANLDPIYCHFTGHADYPVIYQDPLNGRLHKMHWSRVYRWVDQPKSDPFLRGRGMCALSRAIGWVQQFIVQQTYIGESLSHEPPPGILLVNGAVPTNWKTAWNKYLAALQKVGAATEDGVINYLPVVEYINPDPDEKVTIEFIRFSVVPEGWNSEKQYEMQAKGIAAGLNIDVNEIFPVSGGQFGVATQSKILEKKSKGKTIGYIIAELGRFINNRVLPDALSFESKYRDTEKSLEEAQTAQAHTAVATSIASYFPTSVIQQYLVRTVPGLADVALDADGKLIQADDQDVLADDQPQQLEDTVDEVDPQDANAIEDDGGQKDFEDTKTDFERAMYDAIQGMTDGSIDNRRRAGVVIRGHISSYGRKAYIDGLEEGGVNVETLEGDDLASYRALVAENSIYVSGLTGSIYNGDVVLSEAAIRSRVQAWVNKTLESFRVGGLSSADSNGLYEFYGDDGDESCNDCKRLKGKKFRLKDWIASDYLPSSSSCRLECGGWNCEHGIRRVSGGRADRKSLIGLKALPDPFDFEILVLADDAYTVIRRSR